MWGSVDCFRCGMLTLLPAEIAWFSLVLILKLQISLIKGKGWKPVYSPGETSWGNAGLYWITYCKSDKGNCKQNRARIQNGLLMTYLCSLLKISLRVHLSLWVCSLSRKACFPKKLTLKTWCALPRLVWKPVYLTAGSEISKCDICCTVQVQGLIV